MHIYAFMPAAEYFVINMKVFTFANDFSFSDLVFYCIHTSSDQKDDTETTCIH